MASRYDDSRQPKKKGSAAGNFFSTLLLIAAVCVFVFAAWKLWGFYKGYKAGQDEYASLENQFVMKDPQAPVLPDEHSTEAGSEGETSPEKEGVILTKVEELEDPKTVEQVKSTARTHIAIEKAGGAVVVTPEEGEEGLAEDGSQTWAEKKLQLPMLVNPVNFKELQGVNSEVIGWLRIGALDISYPVAQAADNDFYLHRTFKKENVFSGCIFLNCDNTKYMTDQNSIIYGHNMKDGSMFGTLKKLQDQETYDKNPYFWVFTPDIIYQYRIFSCAEVSKIGDPYRTRFSTEDFQNFINNSVNASFVDSHGVKVTTDDRLVTLSTCTGNEATRFIVQGKLEQMYVAVNIQD